MTEEVAVQIAKPTAAEKVGALTAIGRFTAEQVNLIRDTVARGATVDELKLFIAVCGRTGLDPFTKQIHFVKRWDAKLQKEVGTVQTGIDGYRLIAQRSGEYDGQDPREWCGKDGVWTDVWLSDDPPMAARATVYRKGIARGFTAVARYSAYCVTDKHGKVVRMWERMDAEQLAKCAEALALRMAFPNELSGVLTEDEMAQAAAIVAPVADAVSPGPGMAGLAAVLAPPPDPPADPPAEPAGETSPDPGPTDPPAPETAAEGSGGPDPEAEAILREPEGSPLFPADRPRSRRK